MLYLILIDALLCSRWFRKLDPYVGHCGYVLVTVLHTLTSDCWRGSFTKFVECDKRKAQRKLGQYSPLDKFLSPNKGTVGC